MAPNHLRVGEFWGFCCSLQVHGHHPPPEAATLIHTDQSDHWCDLGACFPARLPAVLLLRCGPAARSHRLLHQLARIHRHGLQENVRVMLLYILLGLAYAIFAECWSQSGRTFWIFCSLDLLICEKDMDSDYRRSAHRGGKGTLNGDVFLK